jgi:hypothetical protein
MHPDFSPTQSPLVFPCGNATGFFPEHVGQIPCGFELPAQPLRVTGGDPDFLRYLAEAFSSQYRIPYGFGTGIRGGVLPAELFRYPHRGVAELAAQGAESCCPQQGLQEVVGLWLGWDVKVAVAVPVYQAYRGSEPNRSANVVELGDRSGKAEYLHFSHYRINK